VRMNGIFTEEEARELVNKSLTDARTGGAESATARLQEAWLEKYLNRKGYFRKQADRPVEDPVVEDPGVEEPVVEGPGGGIYEGTPDTEVPNLTPGMPGGGEGSTTVAGSPGGFAPEGQPGGQQPGIPPVEQPGGDVAPGGAGGHEPVAHSDKRRTYDQWGGWRDEQLINGEWVEVSRGVGHEPGPGVDQPGQDPGQPGEEAPEPSDGFPDQGDVQQPGEPWPGYQPVQPWEPEPWEPTPYQPIMPDQPDGGDDVEVDEDKYTDELWPVETHIDQARVMRPVYGGNEIQRMENLARAGHRTDYIQNMLKGSGRGMSTGAGMGHQFGLPPMATAAAQREYQGARTKYLAEAANAQRRTEMAKLRSGEALSYADLLKRQWLNVMMRNLTSQSIGQQRKMMKLNMFNQFFG